MTLIVHSSKKLYVGRLFQCKELWDHPWDDHIQILPLLDSTSLGMKVGSSMIQGSQTASFSLPRRLQDAPFAYQLLLEVLDLLQILPFWYQVNENQCCIDMWTEQFEKSAFKKLLNLEWFWMWMICVGPNCLQPWVYIDKRICINWLLELLVKDGYEIAVKGPKETHAVPKDFLK